LPKPGETGIYKQTIRNSLQAFKTKFKSLSSLEVPITLDVAVSARGAHVTKDLDNIIRDVAPIFVEEFCRGASYLQGYRIYVVDSLRNDLHSDSIRLKILPEHAISEFRQHSDTILERGQDKFEL
jgi:hypothetical protein